MCVKFPGERLKSLFSRPPIFSMLVSAKKGEDLPSRAGSMTDVRPSAAEVALESGANSIVLLLCCLAINDSVASDGLIVIL